MLTQYAARKKNNILAFSDFLFKHKKKQQRKRKNSFSAAAARGSSDFSFPWLFFFFWLAITLAIRSSSKSPMIIITSSIKSTLIPLRTPRSLEAAPEKVRCWTNYSFLLTSKQEEINAVRCVVRKRCEGELSSTSRSTNRKSSRVSLANDDLRRSSWAAKELRHNDTTKL